MPDPRTIQGDTNGTGIVSYALPPGVFQYVQSVRVKVSNGAAVAVRPTLHVAEQTGVVIASKRQGEAIPAGGNGSATWALRLDDEHPDGPIPTQTGVYFCASQSMPPNGAQLSWQYSAGAQLLNLANPFFPKVKDAGLYAITAYFSYQGPDDAGKFYTARLQLNADVFQARSLNTSPLITSVALGDATDTVVAHTAAASILSVYVLHNSAIARPFRFDAYVVKIGL